MSTKITKLQQIQKLTTKCQNKTLVDELIKKYQEETKSAVLHTLNMCETVYEIHIKYKNKELSNEDRLYFCLNVRLDPNGSTYRKYIRIAQYADQFRQLIDQMPSAYSVLYEMTTLEPSLFNVLVTSGKIDNETTLNELKQLTNKNANNHKTDDVSFRVVFNMKNLSKETSDYLHSIIRKLATLKELSLEIPKASSKFIPVQRVIDGSFVPAVNN